MSFMINYQSLPQPLALPAIEITPISQNCGKVFHKLASKKVKNIVQVITVKISPKISLPVFVMDDGERLIVTDRNIVTRPHGIDGILIYNPADVNDLKWQSHKIIDTFNSEVTSKSLRGVAQEIEESWLNHFSFIQEKKDTTGKVISQGLRPPQIGGLHAIGAHWSLYKHAATIVMPTGTGKTETILSATIAYRPGKILIIVPSRILRDQTLNKFKSLGLLRPLKAIPAHLRNPIVGVILNRPKTYADLQIFDNCNVIISTMSALGSEEVLSLAPEIANRIETLIVDEAHHIAAKTWSAFKERLNEKKILQFTATPYRRDGKLVDGKVIFNYPLRSAQLDGYFKPIKFEAIQQVDEGKGDLEIATTAIQKLRNDLNNGYDHLLMARCGNITRATEMHAIYLSHAADLNPVLIHSEGIDVNASLQKVNARTSRIIVCVDMLGEGFDLPQLKIAEIHDTHKSLAVLLQFTGRFTRVANSNIGDATVIANIANQDVSNALERLYSEDADWNHLLSEFSSQAAQTHAALIDFLNSSERIGDDLAEDIEISHHLLRPAMSTLFFRATAFSPENFFNGIQEGMDVQRVWLHRASNTLYFVTKSEPPIKWTRSHELTDRQWDIFVLHYNEAQELLYIASSAKDSTHTALAQSVGGTQLISGDVIFRTLGRINRLIFQNVGVKKHGRRNLSFAMYTGADVAQALSITETSTSVKSNLSGTGWEDGAPVTIGCSLKGRVWSRDAGTIPELVQFCETVGNKILDDTIDTSGIIANVLIPSEVTELPNLTVINIDWPVEILRQVEERVILSRSDNTEAIPLTMVGIKYLETVQVDNQIEFEIYTDDDVSWGTFVLTVNDTIGFRVEQRTGDSVTITIGRIVRPLAEFLSDYPPMIRFVNLSELDGNLLIKPQHPEQIIFPEHQFVDWDWTGTDIQKESLWKNGVARSDSIQAKAIAFYESQGFNVIFDDDCAGEAADIVCLKEEESHIRLVLNHCKFTTAADPGERVKDIVEVCSQAIRSAKWKWKFQDLCRHIVAREKRLSNPNRTSRFIVGGTTDVNRFHRLGKFKEVRAEIVITQPGLSHASITLDQSMILGATDSYLKETIGVDLEVICNA